MQYGDSIDFDGLTMKVLKLSNFVRSPTDAKVNFLRKDSGQGGWGHRITKSIDYSTHGTS